MSVVASSRSEQFMSILLFLGITALSEVGQPVDIASSAYQYRANRPAQASPPESLIAVKYAAHQPLNQPLNEAAPGVQQCLTSLIWEEIRPIQTLELTWPSKYPDQPKPDELEISALINNGASSSWWNNLSSVVQPIKPTVSRDGRTYRYPIGFNTCGLIVSTPKRTDSHLYSIPQVRVLVPQTWKSMDVEVEWGFDKTNASKDYSGQIGTYDAKVSQLRPLAGDKRTQANSLTWRSPGGPSTRRGISMNLHYMGTSKWRKQQQYTTQSDDVARSIVTVKTKSGSFSFLAADLENGPIYAPEYGFFVRRTSALAPNKPSPILQATTLTMTKQANAIAGDARVKGWGTDETPWFGSNTSDEAIAPFGIKLPAKCVAIHPGQFVDAVVQWRSPIKGRISVTANLIHAQQSSNGVDWSVLRETDRDSVIVKQGSTNGSGTQAIQTGPIEVEGGDRISLVVGPKGDHRFDTTVLDYTINELDGSRRSWNLAKNVGGSILEANPHADTLGHGDVWRFGSRAAIQPDRNPSDPPIKLGSNATSARQYVAELKARNLETIRERTRHHAEQTWLGAITATRGQNLPPHPTPPFGAEPMMQVDVPSDRLNAQWILGAWHLLRHCGKNPQTGKLWFNDFPYGILAAETYLVLSVLDQMGSHDEAAAGFDQWLTMPMEREHPVGLFSEARGVFSNAVGPDGYGGNMDTIHAFGPGSIGWALAQHYNMTGNTNWLRVNEKRLVANADWILRQRQVMANSIPGGKRLWINGLQPALQVTPDSGGLWMQFYECEAYYLSAVTKLAEAVMIVDPMEGKRLSGEAEEYRKDLKAAVEKSIERSPVVPVRDGTYHSVIPFAAYVRGLSVGAWGWQREGSGSHVGPLYWDTVQSAAALISPAGLLPANDVRVQGYLDVLEDRVLLENQNVGDRDWFQAGWQYQGGLERTANMHLAADDVPVFLRSFLNCYAVDILPDQGYTFNEHAVHGPPDKIFEEAAFLERFRNLLVMEDGPKLWLDRAAPREWLEQGKRISVKHAPSQFGEVSYEIVSHASEGKILATISLPTRNPAKEVWMRIRHPKGFRMKRVLVNDKLWTDFDPNKEIVKLHGLNGMPRIQIQY